ncbi:FadR/GntR family transcriptional regulator [Halanaerobium saccharolyticum]|uniref:GntR family transcriptional regulator n=1 Tax=Halanaerobium saccharolyticum TaxID=43595 RepID=A0A4R7Z846_9FIRM|nr:FadR/GntR family transcriptional regulator [Halanaerobium saccharolyticum]RAK08152.1 GntR family transcriptional regulator [Halanaerobium saccharolyticum]TDW04359.1 GntR family transcriptional regulator [Halanaerobium saccharolyticum]TDX59650.1 GntR family transcriptional regulator [Halanaerobium saccharolyticum]
MEFKQIKNNKVYEQIIEQIRELIYEGELKKGDKLPSERQLKKDLGVSRASIREAFSALEMIGLIESRPGEGTFIRDSFDEDFFNPLSLILLLNDNVAEELLELRRVLEIDCVKLAAERATAAEIEEMGLYIDDLLSSSGYEEESIKADKMFHYTIARASGNKVLLFFMRSISEAMDFHIKNTRTKLVSKEETMTQFAEQHQQIFKALKNHDPKKAGAEMRNHLDYVEKLINKEIEG